MKRTVFIIFLLLVLGLVYWFSGLHEQLFVNTDDNPGKVAVNGPHPDWTDDEYPDDTSSPLPEDTISPLPVNTESPPPEQTENPSQPSEQPPVQPSDNPPEEELTEIRISFAGDCTIGTDETFTYLNSFPYRYEKIGKDDSYFFRGVKHIFQNDDLTLVNLETTFTTAKEKAEKRFRFKGDPSYVNILKEGSIEMVNISNNHIYDYLEKGFKDTLKTLDQAGILYSGEGYTAYYEVKGITIGSIGYTGWSTDIMNTVKKDLEEVRKNADLVIVSFHWGVEKSNYPNSVQIELGRFCIDQGADIVIGHHPHVIQGIDKYKDKYIVYSLANFCFGGNRNPADKDTFIFQCIFTFKNKELVGNDGIVYACSVSSRSDVNDYQPTLLKGEDRERVINRILEYSKKLKYGITQDDVIFSD
ncbi:MAG TPA: CapA family protein [Clostridiales bacterium]|nr:CapA family protein [Clostridiales bacterium]